MKTAFWIIGICLPLWGMAQDASQIDEKALKASMKETREANLELSEDDFVNAEAKYRRAISRSAENATAPYNLGNAYYEKEDFNEAFGRFKEAGEKAGEKTNKHKAYHNMGNVFMQNKEYGKAVEAYKEALRNNPADEETRYNLALAKEMLKKEQEEQKNDQNEDDQQDQDQDQQEEQNQDNQDQNEGGDQEQKDQQEQPNQDEGESEKEENKEGDGEQKEEKDQKPNPSEEDSKKPPRPNQLSPQQIENLLEAMENEEKKVKEKIDAMKVKGAKKKNEKDW
jgi:tetratricopeptide (TPR) repeat protein